MNADLSIVYDILKIVKNNLPISLLSSFGFRFTDSTHYINLLLNDGLLIDDPHYGLSLSEEGEFLYEEIRENIDQIDLSRENTRFKKIKIPKIGKFDIYLP